MRLDDLLDTARRGRLYPAVIVHGRRGEDRQAAAVQLARAVLCEVEPGERPCGHCQHCRRIVWPAGKDDLFHPDFQVLQRDLRTTTSAGATKAFLRSAYVAPFEARGQVFAIAEGDTLSPEAADALLKLLEEPPTRTPRHFLLLAASHLDLLPTLRSRSLAVFLGPPAAPDEATVEALAAQLRGCLAAYQRTSSPVFLLSAASALEQGGGWEDPRAQGPWATATAAVLRASRTDGLGAPLRRGLLDLAASLLEAGPWRLRGIPPSRILDGLVTRAFTRSMLQ